MSKILSKLCPITIFPRPKNPIKTNPHTMLEAWSSLEWPKPGVLLFLTYSQSLTCRTFTINFSYGCVLGNKSEFYDSAKLREEEFQENPIINWDAIWWVLRPPELWAVQFILAMVSLTEALLIAYLSYKVSSSNRTMEYTHDTFSHYNRSAYSRSAFFTAMIIRHTPLGEHMAANSLVPLHPWTRYNSSFPLHGELLTFCLLSRAFVMCYFQ